MSTLYAHTVNEEPTQTPDDRPGPYFVTAIESSRYLVMSGPYETHAEALDAVSMARDTASDIDGRAWFMSWGTARIPGRTEPGNLEKCHLV